MTTMALPFKIETCNENWTALSLGQSSTKTWCQPSWMVAITKNHKNGCQDGQQNDSWSKMTTKGPVHLNLNL